MRTTVTLDPDVQALIQAFMREHGVGFKLAINAAIRAGIAPAPNERFHQHTFDMGANPDVAYDKALGLAALLEDEEIVRKLALRE
jgi:hypothetical protein